MFSLERPSFEEGIKREWIITNGIGGYASSTTIGTNTRKYHGLLVASLNPPVERFLLLSKVEEEITTDSASFELSANKYPGVVHPQGFRFLERFDFNIFPTFTYKVEGATIIKKVAMLNGHNATIISYEVKGRGRIKIRPLVNCRGFHSISHTEELKWGFEEDRSEKKVYLKPSYSDAPALTVASDLAEFSRKGYWYRNMTYEVERERGYDYREDHYCPGEFSINADGKLKFNILVTGGRNPNVNFEGLYSTDPRDFDRLLEKEIERKNELIKGKNKKIKRELLFAADTFVVKRGKGKSILAGYHWFDDWGRDAMISLPGLTLVTGRYEDARQILGTFASACRGGIIPNRFSEHGVPEYNTADASLWYIYAVRKYLQYTNDYEFVKKLWCVMKDIVNAYRKGTEGICMDRDGLIYSAPQLTWMDAKVGDWIVTPREGKAVEINALWYNALKVMQSLAERFGEESSGYEEMAERTKVNFNNNFWNEEGGYLYDVVKGNFKDASVRPNQIFAVSLPNIMLSGVRAKKVVLKVEEELLTPYGLRSLSPKDEKYRGTYSGDQMARDASYHQGAVWPYLFGPFVSAYVKVNGSRDAEKFLTPVFEHLNEAGLGTVSEIFDGESPHLPRGCISQAWSVAEILRCSFEDIWK